MSKVATVKIPRLRKASPADVKQMEMNLEYIFLHRIPYLPRAEK